MDDDAMMMVGVSLFLENYRDSELHDLMGSVEGDIEERVMRIKEYVRLIDLLETSVDTAIIYRRKTDISIIRQRMTTVEFELRYSMVLFNAICERIIFTTTK
jgi:hypothetical protein